MYKDQLNFHKEEINCVPWINTKNLKTSFSQDGLAALLGQIGWEYDEWIDYWIANNGSKMANSNFRITTKATKE